MGFVTEIAQVGSCWTVDVAIRLTRTEASQLFLAGDVMVSWPSRGLAPNPPEPVSRTSMFVSEVAAKNGGIRLEYSDEQHATAAALALSEQLEAAGLEREPV